MDKATQVHLLPLTIVLCKHLLVILWKLLTTLLSLNYPMCVCMHYTNICVISSSPIPIPVVNYLCVHVLNKSVLFHSHSSYAKIHIPIIASVSEHQPTTWTSFFFDLHILICVFPAGIWFVMKHLTDERVFGKVWPSCLACLSIHPYLIQLSDHIIHI